MSDLAVCRFAQEGVMTSVIKLLEEDANSLTKVDQTGRNALHWAACGGHIDIVKMLLTRGFDKNSKDQSGWSPLMIAVSAGHHNVASYLILDEKADVNIVNSTGQCCLHYAASKNRLEITKLLLAAGTKLDVHDWGGTTPLHRAIALDHLEIAKLLLDHSCSAESNGDHKQSSIVNLKDSAGQTPLHYACEEGNILAAKLLLDYGASMSVEDKDARTPLDVATDHVRLTLLKPTTPNSTTEEKDSMIIK